MHIYSSLYVSIYTCICMYIEIAMFTCVHIYMYFPLPSTLTKPPPPMRTSMDGKYVYRYR